MNVSVSMQLRVLAITMALMFAANPLGSALAQQGQQPPVDPVFYDGSDARVLRFIQNVNQAFAVSFRTGQMPQQTNATIENTATSMARFYKFSSLERAALREVVTQNWVADYYCD